MPRKLDVTVSLDHLEDEILYTLAALEADPDAGDLLAQTETWLPRVDQHRKLARDVRAKVARTDAQRMVANARLDQGCMAFGQRLMLDVEKDRASGRWKKFFGTQVVSGFVRQALSKQVAVIKTWAAIDDEAFAPHKAEILKWNEAAERALVATSEVAPARGELLTSEEQLTEDLTRERDGLHAALAARAVERRLPRGWADTFFRTLPTRAPEPAPEPTPEPV